MKKRLWIVLWLSSIILAAAQYPPHLHWLETGRGRFTVIFPAERWQQAEAALAGAENAFKKLAAYWHGRPTGRIRIVLDDSTDDANGFATFFPFNLVGVNLSEPPPDSELAGGGSWLDLVLVHELAHIFTMDTAAKPFRILRRVFGNQPILYPAAQLPSWVSEGLAVYGESRFTGDGRLNHSSYPLMIGAARRDNLFPGWSRISGTPAAWPGPGSKYLFGAGFMRFLADQYGADGLMNYLERSTSRLVLFSSSRDFRKTFGKPLDKLWNEYKESIPIATGSAPEPLIKNGFLQLYPCPLGEDRLVYYRRDYQSRGAVAVLDLKTGMEKTLFKLDAVNGLSVARKGKKIFLSAIDNFHAFSEFSDLYEYDLEKGKRKRLSRGQRLSQPVSKEGSGEVYCVQRRDGRLFLALFDIHRQTVKILSRAFTGLSQLSLSPDQSLIAAGVKPDEGPWGIGIFSTAGELRAFITVVGANCRQPRWLDNQTLYFIQAGADTTRLVSLSLAENSGNVCTDKRLNGLQQFSLDSAGQKVYFTYFSGRGQEISRLDLAGLLFSPQEFIIASSLPEAQSAAPKIDSRPYRFWRDLLPHYWTPAWRLGGDEFQAGILTSGQDALGIHSFSLEGYYGFSSHRANFLFSYVYDGIFPTLSFNYSNSIDYYSGSRSMERSQELKLASLWPLRLRKRSRLYAYADMHLERSSYIDEDNSFIYDGSYNGFRLGLDFNSAREYYDSISPADGVHFTLQGFIHPKGIGNKWANRGAQADLRSYIPIFRPGVLALRLALARSWNDPYGFTMGGLEGEAGSSLGKNHPFDLLRGFPAGFLWGDRGYLFNLEYRLPLFKIEKAFLPAVSLDRVYLNVFLDLGQLRYERKSFIQAYWAIGSEVALRLAFGGAAVADLALGFAWGLKPQIYLRLGRSF